jgi:uracil-DNA glycosylase
LNTAGAIDLDRTKCTSRNWGSVRPHLDPLNNAQEACSVWLEQQIALLQPKLIVCLGASPQ